MARRLFLAFVVLSTLASAVSTFAAEAGRLSPVAVPTHQTVTLDLDATRTDYSGAVRIDLDILDATSVIEFHAEEMSLDRVELAGGGETVSLECEVGEHGLVTARAPGEIAAGRYVLEVDFSKDYNTQSLGLYRVVEDGVGYLFSQFQAVDARKAFPCWDEPVHKIRWQVTVRIPADQEIVTNSPAESETVTDGVKTVTFRELPPTPSYLLAFAAGPLEWIEIEGMSVPGRVYCTKGNTHLAAMAAEVAPPTLAALEEWFARPYPYEKLDLVAIPEFWPGAMENPGLVTYRDEILLLDSGNASVSQRRFLARVHAHEFAHMWFGDLVTMSWWDDLWLNESFADWLGDKIADGLFPQYGLQIAELQSSQTIMSGDARPSSTAIRKPVDSPDDIGEDLQLAYNKGKIVLRMVEIWVGEEVFRRGVLDYIEANLWGSTVAQDLFSAVSNAADTDLTPILASFLDQPGYPLVTADVDASGGVVTLSQKRFLNHGVEAEAQSWTVPVQLKYSDGEGVYTRSVLLDDESKRVELGTRVEWVHPNAGAYGYYRWRAPADMMYRLAENPELLDERERAVFLSNADALVESGDFAGDEYLAILSAFAGSPEPEAVTAVVRGLGGVEGAFVTEELEDDFAEYVRRSLGPALDRIGMTPREGESEEVAVLRTRLLGWLGSRGGDEAVIAHCRSLTEQFLDDPSSVDAQVAGVALRVAARHGDEALYERCREGFESATDPSLRGEYLGALGSFSDPELQDRTLAYALAGKVRLNEMFGLIGPIMQRPAGQDRVYNWLTSNYDDIMSRVPPMFAQYMPFFASGCSAERLAAAREFFGAPERDSDAVRKSLAKVADQVMDCVGLREREGAAVAEYLEGFASAQ